MVNHLLPFFVLHPSSLAIFRVTRIDSTVSPVANSVAYAVQPYSGVPGLPLNLYLILLKRPHRLNVAIKNLLDQEGLPYTIYKFCITISGETPIRTAISIAITAFPRFCSPWNVFGTIDDFANIPATRCKFSNACIDLNPNSSVCVLAT